MNFSDFHHLDISGHRDIDFIDIRMETDTALVKWIEDWLYLRIQHRFRHIACAAAGDHVV